jgi:hypothetical protein
MTDLNTMTTKELVAHHNAFEGARQITLKTFNNKKLIIAEIMKLQAEVDSKKHAADTTGMMTPSDIAKQQKITAYEVRTKLRAARAAGMTGLTDKNQRWFVAPSVVAKIFAA